MIECEKNFQAKTDKIFKSYINKERMKSINRNTYEQYKQVNYKAIESPKSKKNIRQ